MNRRNFIKKTSLATAAGLAGAPFFSCQRNSDTRPNIILIMADDMGYSDIAPFGGEIPTPHLSHLANNGHVMTQFYNGARCCPTRASLLTGLYAHQAGIGDMTGAKKDANGNVIPSYQGYLNKQCMTIAEVLRENGYQTAISGKWHVGEAREHWPAKRGFDRSFAFINGACDYFKMEKYWHENQVQYLTLDDQVIYPDDDFYMTRKISDHAVQFIQDFSQQDQPFFMYVAYTAPHWPLHALPEDIELFRGKYMKGWDHLREQRYRRMIEMGIIDPAWQLSPRFVHQNPGKAWRNEENAELTPEWDSLSREEKEKWDLRMAVYAAMIYRMDQGIGRIMEKLKQTGDYENTLITFLSDNGACHEPIYLWDLIHDQSGETGTPQSFDAYGFPWANASNTPFRLFKHWAMEGGIASPFIAHYPALLKKGKVDTENVAHIIDIMATCVDLSNSEYPEIFQRNSIQPMEGMSLARLWQGDSLPERTLFWEHEGNWAVRQDKWKLVNSHDIGGEIHNIPELYDLEADRVEMYNLAEKYPDKVRQLKELYDKWAQRVNVYNFR